MGNYSKFIGSLVGGIIGLVGSVVALPAEFQSAEFIGAISVALSAIATFIFPANKPAE